MPSGIHNPLTPESPEQEASAFGRAVTVAFFAVLTGVLAAITASIW